MATTVIGIDLGTTNSALAVIRDGVPTLLPTSSGRILPSVVGVSPEGQLLVGTPARNQWVLAPQDTVRSVKRKMGSSETLEMAGKTYTPQEISAFILKDLKASAEAALGESITRAVITVPAYFNELQRQATIEAGEIAGLAVERIINEPTAAALAYGLGSEDELRVLVYDLGGGTFDVSVIELMGGVLDVRATAGDNQLGGDDFDVLLAERLAEAFVDEFELDPREHPRAWARLLRAAEEAKIALSDEPFTEVALEYLLEDAAGKPLHLRREVSRDEFENLIEGLLRRTLKFVDQALNDAELSAKEIDRVLLVGGSTRIPAVWEMLGSHLGQEPSGEIDPDAVVALGAAVQAGISAGEEVDAILVDVTPLSLGIETAHFGLSGLQPDRFTPLIRRNTTIPVHKSEAFSTIYPGQDTIHIKVYQGEDPVASRNTLLGEFKIEGLTPDRYDGLAEVTVNFSLDVSGILDVTVAEREGGKRVSRQLKASRQRLSPAEIARSRTKLQKASDDVALDETTASLLERAEAVLERPELEGELASALAGLMADIRQVAREGDEGKLQELSDRLVDTLIEAE
jgi:molecular chaperone DnaK